MFILQNRFLIKKIYLYKYVKKIINIEKIRMNKNLFIKLNTWYTLKKVWFWI